MEYYSVLKRNKCIHSEETCTHGRAVRCWQRKEAVHRGKSLHLLFSFAVKLKFPHQYSITHASLPWLMETHCSILATRAYDLRMHHGRKEKKRKEKKRKNKTRPWQFFKNVKNMRRQEYHKDCKIDDTEMQTLDKNIIQNLKVYHNIRVS